MVTAAKEFTADEMEVRAAQNMPETQKPAIPGILWYARSMKNGKSWKQIVYKYMYEYRKVINSYCNIHLKKKNNHISIAAICMRFAELKFKRIFCFA